MPSPHRSSLGIDINAPSTVGHPPEFSQPIVTGSNRTRHATRVLLLLGNRRIQKLVDFGFKRGAGVVFDVDGTGEVNEPLAKTSGPFALAKLVLHFPKSGVDRFELDSKRVDYLLLRDRVGKGLFQQG